ncbi:MAG: hypothetical protein KGH79_00590 [Patescibacteria group bacterium]|nr:hypothetical protein [Patescibacteria group bacterium]
MVLSVELIVFIVRLVQMLGIALGIGAQTVMLVAYLQAIRDGIIDNAEAQFARAARSVLKFGFILIIFSGAASVLLDIMQKNTLVFFEPAYLFKWGLIGVVLLLSFVPVQKRMAEGIAEGVAGGSWYILFFVHILAPVTTWSNLLTLYGVWLVGFMLCWWALVLLFGGKKPEVQKKINTIATTLPPKFAAPGQAKPALPNMSPPKPAAVVVSVPPPPITKPVSPLIAQPVPSPAPVTPPALPAVAVVQPVAEKKVDAKIIDPDKDPGLPAIRVMPKTKQDLDTQNRASVVKFE